MALREIVHLMTINILDLSMKLEDLQVLRRTPDLLNNVNIGQGQLQLIMEQILQPFWSSDLNSLIKLTENAVILRYNFSLSDCHFSLIFLQIEITST